VSACDGDLVSSSSKYLDVQYNTHTHVTSSVDFVVTNYGMCSAIVVNCV
jgi:hypothetical protein